MEGEVSSILASLGVGAALSVSALLWPRYGWMVPAVWAAAFGVMMVVAVALDA